MNHCIVPLPTFRDKGAVVGILKVGRKKLFLVVSVLCILCSSTHIHGYSQSVVVNEHII